MGKSCSSCGYVFADDDPAVVCDVCGVMLSTPHAMSRRGAGVDQQRVRRAHAGPYQARRALRVRPEVVKLPTHHNERQLWTGKRSELGGFDDEVEATVYGVARVANGLYQCCRAGCGGFRKKGDPLRGGKEPWITIDHKESIRSWVLGHVAAVRIGVRGHTFEVYYLDDCRRSHQDVRNLVAMCSTHNSAKGGHQDIDGEVRTHVRDCVGCRR